MSAVTNPPKPPHTLAGRLELDAEVWSAKDIYHLHAALIVPRPIAWVSTLSESGLANLAPHSYFNGISDAPPCVVFSIEGDTDTYRNLQAVPEFVVNFVSLAQAETMELTAVRFPRQESEFDWAKVVQEPASRVRPPRAAGSKACMECRVIQIVDVGKQPNHVVLGEVVHFSVDASVWKDGRVDPMSLDPLCRLGGRVWRGSRYFQNDSTGVDRRGSCGQGVSLQTRSRTPSS